MRACEHSGLARDMRPGARAAEVWVVVLELHCTPQVCTKRTSHRSQKPLGGPSVSPHPWSGAAQVQLNATQRRENALTLAPRLDK